MKTVLVFILALLMISCAPEYKKEWAGDIVDKSIAFNFKGHQNYNIIVREDDGNITMIRSDIEEYYKYKIGDKVMGFSNAFVSWIK